MKLLQIYNSAPHYRTSIFLQMDRTFDCDYVFGESLGDIKQMDTSQMQGKVTKVKNCFLGKGFYWQPGVQRWLCKEYDTYLILGDYHCLSTWLFCLRARLFYRQKRLFFWTHGWYGKENCFERLLKKRFFKMANGGIFLYGNYARELMIHEGFQPDKLFTIHNSLAYEKQKSIRQQISKSDIYTEHFGNDAPVLMFVGRLTKVKHLDMILQALGQLRDNGTTYNFVLVGDGEQRTSLEELSHEHGLEQQVWFYGACYDEQQLSSLIYNADLCVSPGNVGLTAMHVMVFGTPVLTHNDFPYQMPEFEAIHEGETGSFFKRGDVDSLAAAIERWFETNANKREEVRQACYHEIDTQWTPQFQLEVLKRHLV